MSSSIDSHVHIWDRSRNEIFIAENQHPSLKTVFSTRSANNFKRYIVYASSTSTWTATIEHTKFCIDLCKT